jgi:hypothetical protein
MRRDADLWIMEYLDEKFCLGRIIVEFTSILNVSGPESVANISITVYIKSVYVFYQRPSHPRHLQDFLIVALFLKSLKSSPFFHSNSLNPLFLKYVSLIDLEIG